MLFAWWSSWAFVGKAVWRWSALGSWLWWGSYVTLSRLCLISPRLHETGIISKGGGLWIYTEMQEVGIFVFWVYSQSLEESMYCTYLISTYWVDEWHLLTWSLAPDLGHGRPLANFNKFLPLSLRAETGLLFPSTLGLPPSRWLILICGMKR